LITSFSDRESYHFSVGICDDIKKLYELRLGVDVRDSSDDYRCAVCIVARGQKLVAILRVEVVRESLVVEYLAVDVVEGGGLMWVGFLEFGLLLVDAVHLCGLVSTKEVANSQMNNVILMVHTMV